MEQNKYNKLLEKYWAGETTLEEEIILKNHANLSPNHEIENWFSSLNNISKIELNQSIDLPKHNISNIFSIKRILSYAAGVALLVWVGVDLIKAPGDEVNIIVSEETYEDPELALAQAQLAFSFVFNKLKKGQDPASNQLKKIESLSIIIPN